MAFYPGKNASITIGGITYPGDSWGLDDETEEVDVTNFTSGGIQELIAGIDKGTIQVTGVYKGSIPTKGATATFVLGIGGGLTATKLALITKVRTFTDVKGKAAWEVNASITAS